MRFARPPLLLCGILLLAAACAPDDAQRSGAPAAAGREALSPQARQLNALVDGYYEQWLAAHPLEATEAGEHGYDDRFGDYLSDSWLADALALEQDSLAALERIDASGLAGEQRLTYEAFRRGRAGAVEAFRYPFELLPPVQPSDGVPARFARLGSGAGAQPFRTVPDYERFLSRMDGFAAWVDRAILNLRAGAAKGVVLPRSAVERALPQLAALGAPEPQQSVFWAPIARLPSAVRIEDKTRLAQAYHAKLAAVVLPAYRRLHAFLQDEYLARARDGVGFAELPNGPSWYAQLVRRWTGGRQSPDELHELGLREVERLRGEVARLAPQFGHRGELRGFFDSLRADARLHFAEPEALLQAYRAAQAGVVAALPALFAPEPDPNLVLRASEDAPFGRAPDVIYRRGDVDGSRPAVLQIGTTDLASRPAYRVAVNFLRRAVPGSHYQASVARSLTGLPRLRRFGDEPACVEGWSWYAGTLGADLGLYQDAHAQLGAATARLADAARIVIDTGLHARGWTRQQASDYLRANTDLAETEIAADVDRSIASPARALAAGVGGLRILALRERALRELGERFDPRDFHQQLIGSGPLPLDVLEGQLERWLGERRAAAQ